MKSSMYGNTDRFYFRQSVKIEQMRGKTMSKFKKRGIERKGEKKQKILDSKLMDEHLVDLTKEKTEFEELKEE
jgi:hypothetical protein